MVKELTRTEIESHLKNIGFLTVHGEESLFRRPVKDSAPGVYHEIKLTTRTMVISLKGLSLANSSTAYISGVPVTQLYYGQIPNSYVALDILLTLTKIEV